MIKKKKSFFNLVEVALAIAVAGIGIAGGMALFPVGMNASRDAMAENYCGDTAEQLMSYISAYCKNDWAGTIWNGAPVASIPDIRQLEDPGNDWGNDSDRDKDEPSGNTALDWCIPADADALGGIYFNDTDGNHLPDDLSIFKIVRKSGDYEDFAAAVRLWKKPINNFDKVVAAGGPLVVGASYKYGAALYAEVSWPISKPYSKRDKMYFYKEIFNPNP